MGGALQKRFLEKEELLLPVDPERKQRQARVIVDSTSPSGKHNDLRYSRPFMNKIRYCYCTVKLQHCYFSPSALCIDRFTCNGY